jgi:hypothetical protein
MPDTVRVLPTVHFCQSNAYHPKDYEKHNNYGKVSHGASWKVLKELSTTLEAISINGPAMVTSGVTTRGPFSMSNSRVQTD